ncbi:MAG: hypothetical protein ABWY56_08405, partial [Propionibacteriaceae bacterium]
SISASIVDRDRTAFDHLVSRRDPGFAATAARIFDNLTELPLTALSLRLSGRQHTDTSERRQVLTPDARVEQVRVSWRLEGDAGPAEHLLWFTFLTEGDTSTLAGTTDGPGERTAQPMWLIDRLGVQQSAHSTALVAATGGNASWVRRGDAAAAAVRSRLMDGLGADWNQRLVLEVPSSRSVFERVLGVTPGSYASIAAVAWPEGPDPATSAVRIVVNPELVDRLSAPALAILLAHEATHVATRSAASPAPTWLVEGFADYVAFDSQPEAGSAAAKPLLAEIRRDGLPRALPTDAEFTPAAPELNLRYVEAWLACRYLAEQTSPRALAGFYRRVDAGTAVDAAARAAFGFGEADLVRGWRSSLRAAAAQG